MAMYIFITTVAFSQEYWYWQNPLPQGNQLNDLWIFDTQTMLAVGDFGTVIKTSDGGASWNVSHYSGGITNDFYSVFFIDETTGWVGGSDGKILKTTDGGDTWSVKTILNIPAINAFYFHDNQNGWAVGNKVLNGDQKGVFLKTIDGGNSWTIDENTGAASLNAIRFINNNTGWAVGSKYVSEIENPQDIILKTDDGGQTWMPHYSQITTELFCTCFVDDLNGWAVGKGTTSSGMIIYSDDGGVNWTEQTHPEPTSALWGIAFRNQNLGWAVGEKGTLLRTDNGGNQWELIETQIDRNLNSIKFTNTVFVVAVGNAGIMIKSGDNGAVWQELSSGMTMWHFYAVDFTDPDTGWIVGPNKTIIKSVNGGADWTPQASSAPQNLLDVFMVDNQTGWTVGEYGVILKTKNGGIDWDNQLSGTFYFLHACFFMNDQMGWICGGPVAGDTSIILNTSDGGTTWNRQNCTADASLRDIYFIDDQNGWVVGHNSNVFHTVDGGVTWSPVSIGSTEDFYSAYFMTKDIGWIGGNSIRYTDNGGTSWTEQQVFSVREQIRSIHFIDFLIGWAVIQGTPGELYKTMNGGTDWFKLDIGAANNLYDISIVNDEIGWLVGTYSTIMKTDAVFVPVELVSFTANWVKDHVELEWTTATESNNYGFEIQQKYSENNSWQKIGFVEGHGTSTEMHYYSFKYTPQSGGKYSYRLKQVDSDGTFKLSAVRDVWIPSKFALHQNHPNPFNPETKIGFELPISAHVTLDIYNMLGQKIATLIDEKRPAGLQNITWNGKDDMGQNVGSGVYFYHIKTGDFEATRKLVLLR